MLDMLAIAADPWSGSGRYYLLSALVAAARAGSGAEDVCHELVFYIDQLARRRNSRSRRLSVRTAVQQIVKHCELESEMPRPGIDSSDCFPTPRVLAAVAQALYPPERFPRVADVAGASGKYARALSRLGYDVTIIDPRGSKSRKAQVWRRPFLVRDAQGFDLIVAVRACGASKKVARAARRVPTILVPCNCRHVWPSGRAPMPAATAFLRELGVPFRRMGTTIMTGESATRREAARVLRSAARMFGAEGEG